MEKKLELGPDNLMKSAIFGFSIEDKAKFLKKY